MTTQDRIQTLDSVWGHLVKALEAIDPHTYMDDEQEIKRRLLLAQDKLLEVVRAIPKEATTMNTQEILDEINALTQSAGCTLGEIYVTEHGEVWTEDELVDMREAGNEDAVLPADEWYDREFDEELAR